MCLTYMCAKQPDSTVTPLASNVIFHQLPMDVNLIAGLSVYIVLLSSYSFLNVRW